MTDDWKKAKAVRGSVARQEEGDLQTKRRIDKRHGRIRSLMSKKTPKHPRRDELADPRIFKAVQGAVASGTQVVFASRRGDLVTSMGAYPEKDIIPQPTHPVGQLVIQVPHWDHTGDYLKALAWVMVIAADKRHGRAFTLHISATVLDAARKAKADRNIGLARFLRDRIRKHLTDKLKPLDLTCPEFFFWIETDSMTAPHVHGAMIMPERFGETKVRSALRAGLREAGGADWKPHAKQTQAHFAPLWGAAGWVGYISKFELLTKLRLGDENTVAATSGLRAAAKAWYVSTRKGGHPILA